MIRTISKQDALDKENSFSSFVQRMETASKLIYSAVPTLAAFADSARSNISIDVLESIARMRYGLQVAAELLQMQTNMTRRSSLSSDNPNLYGAAADSLLNKCRYVIGESNLVRLCMCDPHRALYIKKVMLYLSSFYLRTDIFSPLSQGGLAPTSKNALHLPT